MQFLWWQWQLCEQKRCASTHTRCVSRPGVRAHQVCEQLEQYATHLWFTNSQSLFTYTGCWQPSARIIKETLNQQRKKKEIRGLVATGEELIQFLWPFLPTRLICSINKMMTHSQSQLLGLLHASLAWLWPPRALTAPTHGGMDRLSWSGWMV